jgi:signal transduction histidine kinase
MGKSEIALFIFIATVVLLVFITGTFLFLYIYRKRKIAHLLETNNLNEQHHRDMLTAQVAIQQETMQHIGFEIHDSVAQKLTLASLYNKQLSVFAAPDISSKMNEIGDIIDQSLNELRQLSKTLTSPQLANAGLIYLLKQEVARINSSGICIVTIECTETELGLPQEKKNLVFRLLQEFMQNSLKHAACKKIHITLVQEAGLLTITAADDGKGFDTGQRSNGIGLQAMRNRASQMNAVYQLISEQGKGTMLNLVVQTG